MKLLILTQKVDKNDDILGFFHGWIAEFAKYCEKITVVVLGVGEYDLPRNVKIFSLGKENISQKSKVYKVKSKLKYIFNFYKYIWRERKNYDVVFVHMNPEYVVLGGLFWKMWRKKVGLWYTHKAVNLKLRLAEKLADIVFSASAESFRLESKKLKITGHGIDIDKFKAEGQKLKVNEKFNILYVGRISPIKNQKLLIEATDILAYEYRQKDFKISLVGSPISQKDEIYQDDLKKIIKDKKLEQFIKFVGSVSNKDIVNFYNQANLSVNLCPTGGVDKTVLESMACELPVVVLNKTFKNILPDKFILKNGDARELARKIIEIIEDKKLQTEFRIKIIRQHSLDNLIKRILNSFYA